MNNYPRVTVGIPVYNQEKFIESTIMSVLNQDYPNLEVIVSDDCSSDNTHEIILDLMKKYKFQYYRNDKNIGMVANYRKILYEYTTGEWYLNLDGDDLLAKKDVISNAIQIIKKNVNQNIILFSGCIETINSYKEFKKKDKTLNFNVINGIKYFETDSLNRNFAHAACLYKRRIALDLNFYCENALNTDFQSLIKLCFHGDIIVTNLIISYWREHLTNQTNSVSNSKNSKEIVGLKKIEEYSTKYIGFEKANIWYQNQLKRAEIYRLVYLKFNSNFMTALLSHFINSERLPTQINLLTLIKFAFLSFRKKR